MSLQLHGFGRFDLVGVLSYTVISYTVIVLTQLTELYTAPVSGGLKKAIPNPNDRGRVSASDSLILLQSLR